MKKTLIIITTGIIAAGSAAAGDIQTVQASYKQAMARVDAGHATKLALVKKRYLSYLNAHLEKSYDNGALERVLWIRNEKAGLEKGQPLAESLDVPTTVLKAGKDFRKTAVLIKQAQKKSCNQLKARYADYFDALTRKLTTQGQIDQALLARNQATALRAIHLPTEPGTKKPFPVTAQPKPEKQHLSSAEKKKLEAKKHADKKSQEKKKHENKDKHPKSKPGKVIVAKK